MSKAFLHGWLHGRRAQDGLVQSSSIANAKINAQYNNHGAWITGHYTSGTWNYEAVTVRPRQGGYHLANSAYNFHGPEDFYGFRNGQGVITGGVAPGTYDIGTFGTGSNGTTSACVSNVYYRRHVLGWTLTQAEIAQGTGASGVAGTISAIAFNITNPVSSSYQPQVTEIGLVNLAAGTANNYNPTGNASLVRVYDASLSLTSSGWRTLTFNITNFAYSGGALGITLGNSQCPTNYTRDGQCQIMGTGTLYYSRTDSSGAYAYNSTGTTSAGGTRPNTRLTFI